MRLLPCRGLNSADVAVTKRLTQAPGTGCQTFFRTPCSAKSCTVTGRFCRDESPNTKFSLERQWQAEFADKKLFRLPEAMLLDLSARATTAASLS